MCNKTLCDKGVLRLLVFIHCKTHLFVDVDRSRLILCLASLRLGALNLALLIPNSFHIEEVMHYDTPF